MSVPRVSIAVFALVAVLAGCSAHGKGNVASSPAPDELNRTATTTPSSASPLGQTQLPTTRPPAPPSTTSASPTTIVAGLGQQASRNQIPWNQVGPGWSLVGWAPQTSAAHQPARNLYVVNPLGGRYLVAQLTANQNLGPWSPDGRRALIYSPSGVEELDLTSGVARQVLAGGGLVEPVIYSRPAGTAFVAIASSSSSATLRKYGADGKQQTDYPISSNVGTGARGLLYSADGLHLYTAADRGVVEYSNDGKLVVTVAAPTGDTNCSVLRPWASGQGLTTCLDSGAHSRLYEVDFAGRTMTALPGVPPGSYKDAYVYGSALVLQGTKSLTMPCGASTFALVQPSGTITQLGVPKPAGTTDLPVGISFAAGKLLLETGKCSQGTEGVSLVSFDLSEKKSVTILGPGRNGGSVFDFEAFATAVG